jgi:hypothetical protein
MQKIIFPIVPNQKGKEVADLQKALQLFLEQKIFKTFQAPGSPTAEDLSRLNERLRSEISETVYGKATTELVRIFQVQQGLGDNLRGTVEERTANKMNDVLSKLGALDDPSGEKEYTVSGMVLNSNGAALASYITEVFVITLQKEIAVGKAVTGKDGGYSVTFKNPLETDPDIEVRTYKQNDEKNVTRSALKYNASPVEKLDVIVNAEKEKITPEFDRILNDVRPHLTDIKLSELKEDKENRHITYMANKTGWDSRITAMLAGAHQLGETLKIDPSHVYALLRAGVPANEDAVKSLSTADAKETISNAVKKNIIPDNGNTAETIRVLENLAAGHLLSSKPSYSVSSMGDMLDLRLNADQKNIFAQTQKQAGNDPAKLWSALAERGFTSDTISRLQLDGKLGYLTGRNAPLMKKIYDKFDLKSDAELAGKGLYKSSVWKEILGNDIPEGLTADEYAAHLAGQVKMSYPTAVAAEMIRNNEVQTGANGSAQELVNFLYANESKKNIGFQPVKTWDGFEQLSAEAKSSAKILERIYQITPSDESMAALSKTGLYSAYQVAKYTKQEFIAKHGEAFPTLQQAEMTYNKANEVYSAALNIATTYLTSQSLPNVYSITGKQAKDPPEIVASPTLEELLGNLDYCDCEHCKSVLSPAAYLVELLQFIDLEDVPHAKSNPVDVLRSRRPDIEHIQLSCENTNMAQPYIDLVNEILEYYLVNGNLIDLKGHDVAEGATQAELLAEPQFVNKVAYDELKTKVFPYNLPFHQPLETLRLLFRMWEVTLENMLAVFSDPLSSRKEALGFNNDEYKTLTDLTFKKLPEYFGEPENNTIDQLNATIANGKAFCRRVGITYEDLAALMKTNFINPGAGLVPLFQKLDISLEDLSKFYAGTITDTQLDAMIPAGIDPDDYAGDVKQWLRDNGQLIMGLITLTDIGPEIVECNFAEVELRFALPDNTNNRLTPLAYHKFHRFLRLLRKTGWGIETLDQIVKVLLPVPATAITDANIDNTFVQLFDRIANFKKTADLLSWSEKKYPDLLLVPDTANTTELRQVQLAKILKISLPEMTELSAFTGIDPLADDLEADEPSLIKFIRIAQQLKAASLKIADLAYILHHHDLTGKLVPQPDSLLKNVKLLKDTLNAIEKENSVAPDQADFNFAKSKMLLVYDAATANNFFELLLNTKTFSAPFNTTEEGLPGKLLAVQPAPGFDPFKKAITFTGILSDSAKTALENAADSLVLADMETITTQPELDTFITDFKTAIGQLFTGSNAELAAFAANFPELKVIYDAVTAEPSPEAQTKKLVELILPELKSKLKLNGLRQALISILKTEPDTVNVLTGKKEVIQSVTDSNQPVLFDFTELEKDLVFDQDQTYDFYIDVPATDDYLIYLSAPQNTVVSLKIDSADVIASATVGADEEVKNAAPLALTAGTLHPAQLTISALPAAAGVSVSWRTKGIEKQKIPVSAITGSAQVAAARTSLVRLLKAAQLQNLFKFTPQELDYFASENTETGDFLNDLDTDGSISAPDLVALWNKLELLVSFKLIKEENEPEENTWLQVLKDPSVKNSLDKLLLEYFNFWQETDLTAVLGHFGLNRDDLSKLSVLKKVVLAMTSLSFVKYPYADVLTWITHDPAFELVAGIKATVRQKVTEAVWLETMQTVSDPVRNRLRDALVSYILQYQKPSPEVTNPDKLYEYFLIDVEMDACMKTSRIRQALSTVQLFIQRCLMNLEPDVDPASIRADHWAWMKRYRVWEANRKVFLYPENWLEPELRDNKSFLFKELEGELLQAEVTDESAELAFLNYLKKLDDIAKLDMTGMYLEENEKGNQFDDILHVFGRTNGNTRQYYYRRFEYGYWTPWEKVSLNVEGDHIFPVVWRKRLFLFWLTTFEKPTDGDRNVKPDAMANQAWGNHAKKNVEVTLCWGEYYKGKWTSPKSTELKRPMIIKNLSKFDSNKLLVFGKKELVENPSGKFRERLVFNLRYRGGGEQPDAVFTFTSKNAPPYMEYKNDDEIYNKLKINLDILFFHPYSGTAEPTSLYCNQYLMPGKVLKVNVKQPFGANTSEITETVLTKKDKLTSGFVILPLRHTVENQLEAPLSYADEHSTFFVSPDESTYIPVRRFEDYYPFHETPVKYKDIPVLVDKPIPGWPPEEILDMGEEVIVSNPWEWNQETFRTNLNFSKMLPTNDTFAFGEVVFDTAGKSMNGMSFNL